MGHLISIEMDNRLAERLVMVLEYSTFDKLSDSSRTKMISAINAALADDDAVNEEG